MNNQEAINSLKNIIEYWTYKPTEVEVCKLAISALERQIPKKRYIKFPYSYCPVCNENITDESPNYCPECGQAIDWGGEDD